MLSSLHQVRPRRLIQLSAIAFAVSLSGCASPKALTINIPPTLREPCARAEISALGTVGDLGGLIVRQEAAVAVCEARRAAVVAIVDAHAEVTKPRKWFEIWR